MSGSSLSITMSESSVIALAKGFKKVDRHEYRNADRKVKELLEQGYTPEEALKLAGIAGYES